jgi:hypothetical protein
LTPHLVRDGVSPDDAHDGGGATHPTLPSAQVLNHPTLYLMVGVQMMLMTEGEPPILLYPQLRYLTPHLVRDGGSPGDAHDGGGATHPPLPSAQVFEPPHLVPDGGSPDDAHDGGGAIHPPGLYPQLRHWA